MEQEYKLIGHGNKSTKFVLDHDNEYVVDFGKWGANLHGCIGSATRGLKGPRPR